MTRLKRVMTWIAGEQALPSELRDYKRASLRYRRLRCGPTPFGRIGVVLLYRFITKQIGHLGATWRIVGTYTGVQSCPRITCVHILMFPH